MDINPFIVGVLVAVASFIIKEVLKDAYEDVQFRKSLVQDIKLVTNGFQQHLIELPSIRNNIDSGVVSFIWDSTLTGLSESVAHSSALKAVEKSQCLRFYDETSRMEEIRRLYNDAIKNYIVFADSKESYARIAKAALVDMERSYVDLLHAGYDALEELDKNHSFLDIDRAHLADQKSRLENT